LLNQVDMIICIFNLSNLLYYWFSEFFKWMGKITRSCNDSTNLHVCFTRWEFVKENPICSS